MVLVSQRRWPKRKKRRKQQNHLLGYGRKAAPCKAPCSNHAEAIDWIVKGEKDGVDLDENRAYVKSKAAYQTAVQQAVRKGAPCSNHAEGIDWIDIREKDGMDLDKNGAYIESNVTDKFEENQSNQATPGQKRKERDLKAVKSDDAEVPVWLWWNDVIRQGLMVDPISHGHSVEVIDQALDIFCGFLM